jgi:hypothetical protein
MTTCLAPPSPGEPGFVFGARTAIDNRRSRSAPSPTSGPPRPSALVIYGYELDKNLDQAEFGLHIPAGPGAREIEAALFDEAVRRTAELGRKRLVTGMPDTMDPTAFALRHGGAKHTDTAICSMLDLGAIDRAQYAAWAEPSAKNSQYTLVRWIGPCPDEHAESYCAALDAMADQPIGTFEYEWAKNDVARLRHNEAIVRQVGGRKYAQVALDTDGEVAGFNLLMAFADEPGFIEIWDTGVAGSIGATASACG